MNNKFYRIFSGILFTTIGLLWFNFSSAAVLYGGSATQVAYEGETFVLDWYLDTENISLNTISLKIKFNNDVIRVKEVAEGNSTVSIWLKRPTFDNEQGVIELTGGTPNGFTGSQVPIFRTVFESIKPGNAQITMDTSSLVLRNDGQGTSETLRFRPIEFAVVENGLKSGIITSPTHPDQNSWYQTKNVSLNFTRKPEAKYSYSFSSNLEIFPDDQVETQTSEIKYENLPDGIYYFKLNSQVGPTAWQEEGVYRIQIDNTPPEHFFPEVGTDPNVNEGDEFLSFSTLDKTSGIWHYEVKLGWFNFNKDATSPYRIKGLIFGNKIQVTAYDLAGNFRTETIPYKGISLWIPTLVLLAALLAASGLWFKFKKTSRN